MLRFFETTPLLKLKKYKVYIPTKQRQIHIFFNFWVTQINFKDMKKSMENCAIKGYKLSLSNNYSKVDFCVSVNPERLNDLDTTCLQQLNQIDREKALCIRE